MELEVGFGPWSHGMDHSGILEHKKKAWEELWWMSFRTCLITQLPRHQSSKTQLPNDFYSCEDNVFAQSKNLCCLDKPLWPKALSKIGMERHERHYALLDSCNYQTFDRNLSCKFPGNDERVSIPSNQLSTWANRVLLFLSKQLYWLWLLRFQDGKAAVNSMTNYSCSDSSACNQSKFCPIYHPQSIFAQSFICSSSTIHEYSLLFSLFSFSQYSLQFTNAAYISSAANLIHSLESELSTPWGFANQ